MKPQNVYHFLSVLVVIIIMLIQDVIKTHLIDALMVLVELIKITVQPNQDVLIH